MTGAPLAGPTGRCPRLPAATASAGSIRAAPRRHAAPSAMISSCQSCTKAGPAYQGSCTLPAPEVSLRFLRHTIGQTQEATHSLSVLISPFLPSSLGFWCSDSSMPSWNVPLRFSALAPICALPVFFRRSVTAPACRWYRNQKTQCRPPPRPALLARAILGLTHHLPSGQRHPSHVIPR